ncbi:related to phosphatidate cytidylyltransferase [Cephalotrichum gorgonifer]|uniref:dolichol kinase n=1 Tax=Cephalotrichum gorgonifer TaxID=2041049 RepID=A0AAE8MRU7_9PEZI|nr:related to phosphatidate cytidylyltransferase [Cephalotrichum gorgonifer]
MPALDHHLKPPQPATSAPIAEAEAATATATATAEQEPIEGAGLRLLSRSPHPYRRQSLELPYPSDRLHYNGRADNTPPDDSGTTRSGMTLIPPKDSPFASDSGTEADDEHYLKGLPAPKTRLHKGLRGRNEVLSGSSSPTLSPTIPEHHVAELGKRSTASIEEERRHNADRARQARVAIRRYVEVALVASLVLMVTSHPKVRPVVRLWFPECLTSLSLMASLLAIYPLRLFLWARKHRQPSKRIPFKVPTHFDPAPILYPQSITVLTTLLISTDNPSLLLPNLVLSLCSLPEQLIPSTTINTPFNSIHWLISCIPLYLAVSRQAPYLEPTEAAWSLLDSTHLTPELVVLLYPLHWCLREALHHLTTTSLLPAELELFAIALINVLLLSSSPQMRILKALLWVGGLSVVIICGPVITWGIALARVPRWRFRRDNGRPAFYFLYKLARRVSSWGRLLWGVRDDLGSRGFNAAAAWPSSDDSDVPAPLSAVSSRPSVVDGPFDADVSPRKQGIDGTGLEDPATNSYTISRSKTFPVVSSPTHKRMPTHTAAGRKRRSMSISVREFCALTQRQATARKWIYAAYVYVSLAAIIVFNVREYITRYALDGQEAIGWALAYFFGHIPWFRLKVLGEGFDDWIPLPPLPGDFGRLCHEGWVQNIRVTALGTANTRLLISAYWVMILAFGLVVVYRLKDIYEVDTRRKAFHFMMVGMFLPATYVDPHFAALSLAFALAIFLILDLLRASQLPPLSKPIATFLAPYVDGRDFRGPVVISHIFLLVGCAIPLWLTLASLPRGGDGGWEVPVREVSMVSGVICVGLGDAAASLIGRRWGHHKWVWGGGKSLEGSAAFAAAVFMGLMTSVVWLRVGRWPVAEELGKGAARGNVEWLAGWGREIRNAGICASVASLTEAVLTGGNDNVVVPVMLWTCVKSIGA